MLIMVKGGEVIHFTPKMGLRHSEFVKRSTGQLPAGAWVGTVSKRDGQVAAITSKHFFGYLSFVLAIVVLASCTRDSGSRQESEFTKRDRQFQRDYCSTNIIAAAE